MDHFFLGNETSHFRQRIFGWKSVEGLGVGEVVVSREGGNRVETGWKLWDGVKLRQGKGGDLGVKLRHGFQCFHEVSKKFPEIIVGFWS